MSRFDCFVVFAEMRTGSNLLEAALNELPGVTCHGEAFNPALIGYPKKTELLGIPREARDADPMALWARIKAAEAWLAYWQGTADRLPATPPPNSVGLAYRQRLEMVRRAAAALVEKTPYPLARTGGDGWGVGQCLTARGVLTHAVHVVDGRVARYCVLAPTDQLFADGLALQGLLADRGFATLADAQQALDQAILALDPCLPYTLDVQDA